MDHAVQYPGLRHQLFQSTQLPPPAQLRLPNSSSSSFVRSNILPPIIDVSTQVQARYQNYPLHPSSNPPPSVVPPLPSPSSSQHGWSSLHRTSNSREEIHPSQMHHHHHHQHHLSQHDSSSDHESNSTQNLIQHRDQSPPHHPSKDSGEDGMPATSDFVKKLAKMLEDPSFAHVVSWGPAGDCFVVKDMNEFTKSILPRMFKHSNFASFVRQLNKYDFHKVKNTDDNQFGEHSWTFRHPDFHANRRDSLENIKRKVPTQRKSTGSSSGRPVASTSPGPYPSSSAAIDTLQAQVERLSHSQDEMSSRVRSLEHNYQDVLSEMVNYQRNMAQQDQLMQTLISYFLQVENAKTGQSSTADERTMNSVIESSNREDSSLLAATQEVRRLIGASYPDAMGVARASLTRMNELSSQAGSSGMSFSGAAAADSTSSAAGGSSSKLFSAAGSVLAPQAGGDDKMLGRQEALATITDLQRARLAADASSLGFSSVRETNVNSIFAGPQSDASSPAIASPPAPATHPPQQQQPPSEGTMQAWLGNGGGDENGTRQGLHVYTLGHLFPRDSLESGNPAWSFDAYGVPVAGPGQDVSQEMSGMDNVHPIAALSAVHQYGDVGGNSASTSTQDPSDTPLLEPISRPGSSQTLRVRRSTFVPGWAVSPRVLLVDDDAVNRKLSSKFLQVFGCTIDVAVDGVGAVQKMNLEKYDLVLMDIVMPKMDGLSATSIIRQFDPRTPIISMTSNSKPSEIMSYYSSGMNDILPKPFTKEGLLDMLEKHLMHLKIIKRQMSKVPRSVGIPPLSDSSFEEALATQAAAATLAAATLAAANITSGGDNPDTGEDDGQMSNPLAGMGLSDDHYNAILQNLVSGDASMGCGIDGLGGLLIGGEKRALEDISDPRGQKKSRFEVLD